MSDPFVEIVCDVCRKPFKRYACKLRHGPSKSGRRFCSKACLGVTKRHRQTYACGHCGKSFDRRDGEAARSGKQFCSRACFNASRPPKETTYIKRNGRHVHRVVVEQAIGRALTSEECIHHIDGNKHNNAISNLALCPTQAIHAAIEGGSIAVDPYRVERLVAA